MQTDLHHGLLSHGGTLKIGFTYDLRDEYLAMGLSAEDAAEFDSLETIGHIDGALSALGHSVDRIGGIRALCGRLARGDRWDLVWNICEGRLGDARESQVPALLDAFGVPYVFSGPLTMALCLHKPSAKRVVRDAGIPTARFHVVSNRRDVSRVDIPYPLFIKPVAEGSGKGVTASSPEAPRTLRFRLRQCANGRHEVAQDPGL